MKDFLRAEWSTLLLVALVVGAAYAAFVRGAEIKQQPPRVKATVVPGEQLADIALGTTQDAVKTQLGEPQHVAMLDLEITAWHYPDRVVYLHAGAVTAVEQTLAEPGDADAFQGILSQGHNLTRDWTRASTTLGDSRARLKLAGERVVLRYPGLLTEMGTEKYPEKIVVVPEAPEDRPQR